MNGQWGLILLIRREKLPGFDGAPVLGESAIVVCCIIPLVLLARHVADFNAIRVAKGRTLKSLHPTMILNIGGYRVGIKIDNGVCSKHMFEFLVTHSQFLSVDETAFDRFNFNRSEPQRLSHTKAHISDSISVLFLSRNKIMRVKKPKQNA